MSDFNVQINVRNGRLLRLIRQDYESSADMGRRTGISHRSISALVTMRMKPTKADGDWTDTALNVAGALGVDPDEIWPERMREAQVRRGKRPELDLSLEQVAQIASPVSDPADLVEQRDTLAKLMSCLTERERGVIEALMGGATTAEIAREQDVTAGRMHQIQLKSVRKMAAHAERLKLTDA